MARKARKVFESLVDEALHRGHLIANPDGQRFRRAQERGESIPEVLHPGGLVRRLPLEDREVLRGLLAEDTQDRMGG